MHDLFVSSFFQVKNLKTNMPADQITYSEKYNDEKYEYRYDKLTIIILYLWHKYLIQTMITILNYKSFQIIGLYSFIICKFPFLIP